MHATRRLVAILAVGCAAGGARGVELDVSTTLAGAEAFDMTITAPVARPRTDPLRDLPDLDDPPEAGLVEPFSTTEATVIWPARAPVPAEGVSRDALSPASYLGDDRELAMLVVSRPIASPSPPSRLVKLGYPAVVLGALAVVLGALVMVGRRPG